MLLAPQGREDLQGTPAATALPARKHLRSTRKLSIVGKHDDRSVNGCVGYS